MIYVVMVLYCGDNIVLMNLMHNVLAISFYEVAIEYNCNIVELLVM